MFLIFVFIMSAFLDNIAAALIGGTIALVAFRKKVHIGYIAAIVASSNAGVSGSLSCISPWDGSLLKIRSTRS